jgi:vacuolar-type H+-ATPase subunit I/STV1
MATLSGITFLSGFLRLSLTYNTHHRVAPSAVGPFDTLFTGVACLGFGRLYQLLGRSKSNAISGTQTEIELAHVGFIFAWFGFLFMAHEMHLPQRSVSAWVFVVVCGFAAYSVVVGFVLRKRFVKQSAEAIPHDPRMANRRWRAANLLSFCSAINLSVCGAALKYFGSDWLLPGIFFGLSLGFLLLWRPCELAVSTGQPA